MSGSSPIYVQYGCGCSCPSGWLNFDASPTLRLQRLPIIGGLFRHGHTVFPKGVRYGDVVRGLPIADASAQGIYASHVLEHLPQADFWVALHNTFRMLKPGGIFRLVVPDLQARAERYLRDTGLNRPEANSWFMQATGLGRERRSRGLSPLLREAFGRSVHLWMWDENSLAAALHRTGFIGIRRCRFGDCADAAFQQVEEAGRFHDSRAGIEECAMEAVRPARRDSC
jgi:SAM-dependent methyltransferase